MATPLSDIAANVWSLVPSSCAADAPDFPQWPCVLILAAVALAALPGLARTGADAFRRFARRSSRAAFFAGAAFAGVLFCQADKFPSSPVQSAVDDLGRITAACQAVLFAPEGGTGTLVRAAVLDAGAATGGLASAEGGLPLLTDANRVSGLALVSASAAAPGWDVPPGAAVTRAPWLECGAHLDFFGLALPDAEPGRLAWEAAGTPPFPVGTNLHARLFASVCGAVSFGAPYRLWPDAAPVPDGAPAPLFAPLKGPLGIAPPQGSFWRAATPSNTLLLTWRGVFLNRDSNSAASVQCELAPSGDFAFRVRLPEGAGEGFATGVQNNGGGESVRWDSNTLALARSPGGIEIRGRGFGLLPPGSPEGADADGDGLDDAIEVFSSGTSPLLGDTDGDGLRDGADPAPLNPDADGDLAADSADPAPLVYSDPAALPGCCTNAWLFHVHNGLPSGGTGCPLAADPLHFATNGAFFPVTVSLSSPVAAPGAVLWVGRVPLVMRDPGAWVLWLDKATNHVVRLCAPRGSSVDYGIASAEPGFFFQSAPPALEMFPLPLVSRAEGAVAAPFLTVEPAAVCFHGRPVTFRASGCATGLSGQYMWTYGGVTVVTNVPEFTVSPDAGGLPSAVSVSFMPDGVTAAAPAGGGRGVLSSGGGVGTLSATGAGWPTSSGSGCSYCLRSVTETTNETWWCDLTGGEGGRDTCPAAADGLGYIAPADGTNTWRTLAVSRRPSAWPRGGASFRPWPVGHAGQGTPPPPPPPSPDDCGGSHDGECDCSWVVDHWHRRTEATGLFHNSGCCACPEHNRTSGSSSAEPVIYDGSTGLTVEFKAFDSAAPSPLSPGPLPNQGAVYVTGLTPSTSPYDRTARFTHEDKSVPTTFFETDRFTVMSLDLQPDVSLDGAIGEADADALAAGWDRAWTLPASTNVWFPVKVFNDVALPGVYTLAVSGCSNVLARYGSVLVRGGESNAVAFPPGSTEETVEVQAEGPGDATLRLSFAGSGSLTNYACRTEVAVKAWGVGSISVTSPQLGTSPNPPPFPGMTRQVFRPDRSPDTDRHAVVLYGDVADAAFNVQDFDVTLTACLALADMTEDGLSFRWEKVSGPGSGQLLPQGSAAVFRNPKLGGVYRFRLTVGKDGTDWSFGEANLVLPLAGAEMDGVVNADLARADAFAAAVKANSSSRWQLQNPKNWRRWFWDDHAGDYTGRPDSANFPTVWFYNQVNDGSGFGVVCTWKGRPVRLTKLSNFILGYAMQQIGTSRAKARRGTGLFTISETTDRASVGAGWDIANGENYDTTVSALVDYIWMHEAENDKSRRLWPNPGAPDNYKGSSTDVLFDYNTWYGAPGFLFMTQ